MKMNWNNGCRLFSCLLPAFMIFLFAASCEKSTGEFVEELEYTTYLKDNWYIRPSSECKETGETISTPAFNARGWVKTPVPSTVLAALVKNNIYKDIYFAGNLEKIPGEQFQQSWWYRKEFNLEGVPSFSAARLVFEGINYRADIWLNGRKIASSREIIGSFRIFDLDVTNFIYPGRNVLAVEVFPPKPGDFTIGFVDWNPAPPDKNMGLWRGVKLRLSGPVSLNHPFVQGKVNLETLKQASLTITAQLTNHSKRRVSGVVTGEIEGAVFSQPFSLGPLEKKKMVFSPDGYKELQFQNPRLWWPHNLGTPHLYRLKMAVLVDGYDKISDSREITFGIREAADYINEGGHRGYRINGKDMLIRGGGWVDDMLLADEDSKIEAQINYIRHMNLSAIRLEGFWGSSRKLYDLADRYGILVMAGWSCQWEWRAHVGKPVDEFGGIRTPAEMDLAVQSLRDQVIWLRNHPAIFVWVLGSDKLPRPQLEKKYYTCLDSVDPTRPRLASCKYHVSKISGATAVKMNGPYDYVPPIYWYIDKKNGGAFGFNTETGPGPQPPPLESLRRMIPKDRLWPIDDIWEYHCGRHKFSTLNRYMRALEHRYGKPGNVEDFARKAQAANYEAIRAMFEAFGVNKPNTTGIIQWMLNSAWPKMFWQLYDYYLMPNGAFYGCKTACQPLNIVYHYENHAVYIVNDTLLSYRNLNADVRVFNFDSKEIFSRTLPAAIGENRSKKVLDIPGIKELSPIYFIDLKLKDRGGKVVGDNFYWLSTKKDILDEKGTTWYYTPTKEFADFTGLARLPEVTPEVTYRFETANTEQLVHVTLKNPTDKIAFFIELKVKGKQSGRSILPVFWDDNYISLLPGEIKIISGRFSTKDAGGENPVFVFSGWNIKK
jgi:exo-1,4-beta-D-glucosaminidase